MKNLAFVVALAILALGVVGILVPSSLVWIGLHSVTSGAFYVIAAVRVSFGLILISVAPASRAPRALRILGYIILIAGIATALAGLLAIERVHAIIDGWAQLAPWIVRLSTIPVLALGGFIAYACAPARRT